MDWLTTKNQFVDLFENFLHEIEKYQVKENEQSIIFIGHMLAFDKGTSNYIKELKKKINTINFFVLNESIGVQKEKIEHMIPFDFITVPRTSALGQFDPDLNLELEKYVTELINSKDYLKEAVSTLYKWHDQMGKGYAEWFIYYVYKYYIKLIECLNPIAVIYWNKFNVLHNIFECVCNERNIKNVFWEHGSLPGSFALETEGQMGESAPAVEYSKFKDLPVDQAEIDEASYILSELKRKRVNRNNQPKTDLKKVLEGRIIPDKPTLLYTGQNDFESGMIPYTEHTKQYHSPCFISSDDAALFLSELAKKNDWNLIYKPHPLMVKYGKCKVNDDINHLIIVNEVDLNDLIDFADVTVTILSQCGYAALIREKPVLMLGYIQLKGKDCTYEAFEKNQIETEIKRALRDGFTERQKKSFEKHIAQMKKYYLFDNLLDKQVVCGKGIDEASSIIRNLIPDYREERERNLIIANDDIDVFLALNIVSKDKTGVVYDLAVRAGYCFENARVCGEFCDIMPFVDMRKKDFAKYSDIYFSDISLLKDEKFIDNIKTCNLKLHIFDNPDMTLYLKKDFCLLIEKAKIKEKVREILAVCPSLITYNSGIPVNMLAVHSDENEWKALFMGKQTIPQKYVYVESYFFTQRIMTNEFELIEEIRNRVGNKNFAVICYSRESLDLFQRKGYNAFFNESDKLECNLFDGKVIFSSHSSKYIFWTLILKEKNLYINMSKWIVGSMSLRKTDGFKAFIKQCRLYAWNNQIYVPCDKEEIEELFVFLLGGRINERI